MLRTNRFSIKEKSFLAIAFFYILCIVFPLLTDITHVPDYVPALVVVFFLLFMYKGVILSTPMKWTIVYIMVLLIYALVGKKFHINGTDSSVPALWRITIEAAWILPSVLISSILVNSGNTRLHKWITIGTYGFLIISFIYILPLIMTSAGLLRDAALGYDPKIVRPLGFPGYDLLHAYTLLLLPVALLVKTSHSRSRIISSVIFLLLAYVVVKTSITTSLFVMVLIILFSVAYNVKRPNLTFVGLCIIAILIYILYEQGFFLWLVDYLMPTFKDTAVESKLQDFHNSMVYGHLGGGTIDARTDFHQYSKDSFVYEPLFGGGKAGGHSKVLDVLGSMGLFGFIPFFMILFSTIKSWAKIASDKASKNFIYFSFIVAGVYLYEKGIFGGPGFLSMLVLVPCAIVYIGNSTKRKS
jgi:hypothetical protein